MDIDEARLVITLGRRVLKAVTLERCARIHLFAEAAGGREIVAAEVEAGTRNFRPHYLRHMWEANRARVLAACRDLGRSSAAVALVRQANKC